MNALNNFSDHPFGEARVLDITIRFVAIGLFLFWCFQIVRPFIEPIFVNVSDAYSEASVFGPWRRGPHAGDPRRSDRGSDALGHHRSVFRGGHSCPRLSFVQGLAGPRFAGGPWIMSSLAVRGNIIDQFQVRRIGP
jgi:hypothetical protein